MIDNTTETAPAETAADIAGRVHRDELAEALTFARLAVPTRANVPVLTGVMLTAGAGHLAVAAHDYETAARELVPTVDMTGRALVPAAMLADVLKSTTPGAVLTLSTVGDRVTVDDGDTAYQLPALPIDEYPELPVPGTSHVATVPAGELAAAVAAVTVAADRGDNLPVLTGVQVSGTASGVTLVATDRYRLAVAELPASATDGAAVLVPARTLSAVLKMYGKSAGDVTITSDSDGERARHVTLAHGARTLTARTLDGTFPQWSRLFPDAGSYVATVTLPASAIVDSLKRVTVAAERNKPVRLTVDGAAVTFGAGTDDGVAAERTVPAIVTGGLGAPIGFKPAYLADAVKVLGKGATVRMSMTETMKPAVLTDDNDDAPNVRYLVMPVRLGAN